MREECSIDRVSGELRDPVAELRYRAEYLHAHATALRTIAVCIAVGFSCFTVLDLGSLGVGMAWAALLALRVAVAALVVAVAVRVVTRTDSFVDGSGLHLLTAAQLGVFAVTLTASAARPGDAVTNALSTTVVMLGALVVVPGRFRTQVALAVALVGGFVAVSVTRFEDPPLPLGPLVMNLAAAVALGSVLLSIHNRRQREQWCATRRERAAREALDAELVVAAELRAELQRLARQDPLTQTANRRELLRVATDALEDLEDGHPLSLVLLDVDRFKSVNDRFGHATGDAALVELVALVAGALRTDDLLARLGGEEFAVLLPGLDATAARRTAERIRSVVGERLRVGDPAEPLTVSVGVAAARDGDTVDDLLARADAAMYAAKRSGGDAVRIDSGELPGPLVEVDHQ
jgi:diguanylate cyclase (GGDEF)-like protein